VIPWIQVYSNLPQHPKTSRLADELNLSSTAFNPNTLAVGLLVCLWTWAIQNACDGDLSGCSPRSIAEACQWKKKPDVLIQALMKSGYLDADMRLHDWEEYASLLMEQEENRKAKTRDRVKRYRERKSQEAGCDSNVDGNASCNVTDTLCNAPTVPNLTVPDLTRPNYFSGGGGDAGVRAQASDAVIEFFRDRGLDPSVFFGMNEETYAECAALTDEVFKAFTSRRPTRIDVANVFTAAFQSHHDEVTDTWEVKLSQHNRDLLMYAFEAAGNAGKAGDWKYINGVLGKLHQRNIRTLGDAENYDFDRLDGGL
jgi:hypothetical protein